MPQHLDQELLNILVCPQDKEPVSLVTDQHGAYFLYNPRLRAKYPIIDGVPVMLKEEAILVTESEHEKFSAQGVDE